MYKRRSLIAAFLTVLALTAVLTGCVEKDTTTAEMTSEPSKTTTTPPQPPKLAWDKTFGGQGEDKGFSVQQPSDGGYIITGVTTSFGAGGEDLWFIKTDADGNKVWDKTFGGESGDAGASVLQTSDSGYIIAGFTNSFGAGGTDVWLIKTDARGNKIWDKTFGGTDGDLGFSVLATPDGGYIITGGTFSFGAGLADALVIKTDSDGNELWSQAFGGMDYDHAWSAQSTPDGGYIIIGGTDSFGHGDVWLIKIDGNGNKIWDKAFEGGGDDYGFLVQPTEDGGYILAGTGSCGAGKKDFWFIKTDADGNKMWDKAFGGPDDDDTASAQQTSDGGYVIAGVTNSFGAAGKDAWLVKTDAHGNKLWDKTFGGADDDYASSVWQTSDGGYIILGYTNSFGAGGHDLWLIKLSP